MRYSLVSSKMPACDVLVDSLSAHKNTPETEACMFRRAFVHVAFVKTAHVKNGRQVDTCFPYFTSLVHWLLWILIVRE